MSTFKYVDNAVRTRTNSGNSSILHSEHVCLAKLLCQIAIDRNARYSGVLSNPGDEDYQRIVSTIIDRDGYRTEFGLELARKYAAQRDFETALRYMEDYVTGTGTVPLWDSNFYLYLLARNGQADRANPVIAQMRNYGRPESDRFIEWYVERFPQTTAGLVD